MPAPMRKPLLQEICRPQPGRIDRRRGCISTKPTRSGLIVVAILYVLPPLALAHWDQAIAWCSKSVAGIPQLFYPYLYLVASYAWAGRDKEAKDAAAQLQKLYPGFTLQPF